MRTCCKELLLPHCGMRTCRKELLDPIAGLGELVNIRVWFPTVMLEERGGHGGGRSSETVVKKIVPRRGNGAQRRGARAGP